MPASLRRALCDALTWRKVSLAEPFFDESARSGVQQLHRSATLESPIAAFGQPDAAHSSLTDERNQSVGANGLPFHRRDFRRRAKHGRSGLEKSRVPQAVVFAEEDLEFGRELRIASGDRRDVPRKSYDRYRAYANADQGALAIPSRTPSNV
jgi:hypothetical protein